MSNNDNENIVIRASIPSNWEMYFSKENDFRFEFREAPCWFHRIMQRLIFGFRWKKK